MIVLASNFFFHSSVSFSCRDFFSPARLQELTAKISSLELLLEIESQQKNEAMKNVDALDERVKELELQLKSEAHQSHEDLEKTEPSEQRAEELETQLQSDTRDQIHSSEHRVAELEAQLKHEATAKAEFLELRVTDLERQLNEQNHLQDGADTQVKCDSLGLGSSSDYLSTDVQTSFCR